MKTEVGDMSFVPLFDRHARGGYEGAASQSDGEPTTWRKLRLSVDVCNRFRYFSMNGVHSKRAVDEASKVASSEFPKLSSWLEEKHNCELVGDVSKIHEALISKFRVVAQALRAVQKFKLGLQHSTEIARLTGYGSDLQHFEDSAEADDVNHGGQSPYKIGPHELQQLMQKSEIEAIQGFGGVVGLTKLLRTDATHGCGDDDAAFEERRAAFGSNKVPSKPGKGFWSFVWDACHDTTLIILMICAVVSLAAEMWSDGPKEGWYDGVSIAAAVVIVIVVTATSDYRQSLQFLSLSEEKRNIHVEVIRGGRRCKISVFDIVVGDIAPLGVGDQVPADGILVGGHSLTVDESSMTGESHPVSKSAKQPFLMAGCKVVDGYGTMLVIAVGLNTEWGQVMATLSEDNGEETPLQARLAGAAKFIGQVGLTVAVVVFIILFIRFFAVDFKKDKKPSNAIKKIVNDFAIAVTIVVVAVPEGLPLAVTLTLAYSMRKMMNDKSMVRKLAACETMGSATTICSDKTGTLTLNQMTVVRSLVAGKFLEPESIQCISKGIYETLLNGVCQNSSGSVFIPKDGGKPEVSGSPTESAALSWGLQIGMDYDESKRRTTVIHVETFNSAKKRAGVVIRLVDGNVEAHWKGAAEIILGFSNNWVDESGTILPMTSDKALELNNCIGGMAAKSLRCVAFAYRSLPKVPNTEEELREWEIPCEGLTFLCVIGIKDPCRPGVREAVGRCQAARVKVRMVTGDSLLTAKAIAEECGILTEGGEVIEGREFRELSKEGMEHLLPKLQVVARSSPSDKLLLVKELKKRGEVVGVTGDGTNDAPALHEADVGLSMGLSGTEVAKESSDIVILDDNFASIVKVVRWGRSVYSNIQKFIQFQLTVNATALVINFVAAVSSGKVPLTAVQLLWVNLIMDTLGALALATEAPTDDLMDRTPVGRKEPLITNVMWRDIISQSLYQIAVLMTIDYAGKSIFNLQHERDSEVLKNTIVFNAFVMCQVFNEVNARRPEKKNIFEGLFRNHLFVGIIVIEVAFQFVIVQFLKKFATTRALTWQQWLVCVAIGSAAWPIAFLVKFLPVREKPYVYTHGIKRNWRRRKTLETSSTELSDANAPEHLL